MTMYVITHKHFNYHGLPSGYKPILVGANQNNNPDNFIEDNQGDNISNKNDSYCELTGLYWFWKHGKDENAGLSHYRRFFADYHNRKSMYFHELIFNSIKPINVETLDDYLDHDYDWIASQHEYGGPGTLWQQFNRNHNIQDMKTVENIIRNEYPDYLNSFEYIMKYNNVGSFFNMFYTRKRLMDQYCEWLFELLEKVENSVDISNYNPYQKRLYGFLAERLMNVWLYKNNIKVKYLPVFQTNEVSRGHVLKLIKERLIY